MPVKKVAKKPIKPRDPKRRRRPHSTKRTTHLVAFRLDNEEYARWNYLASRQGTAASLYIRDIVILTLNELSPKIDVLISTARKHVKQHVAEVQEIAGSNPEVMTKYEPGTTNQLTIPC